MIKIKKIINCFSNPGFYKSYINGVSPLFEISPLLKKIDNAKTLIDIGSNKGQSILITKKFFPNIQVYSFEPLEDQINLQKKIIGNKNILYHNLALGNKDGLSEIYVTNRKDSSSLLKPIKNLNDKYDIKETKNLKLQKIDNIINFKDLNKPIILKLDVQGFELEVLKGAEKLLYLIDYIITEISFVEIYENQVLSNDLINFLNNKSFSIIEKCNMNYLNGKPFQEDVLFAKNKKY